MPSTTYSDRYPEPVATLLTLGESSLRRPQWHEYGREGITPEHVPLLMELAQDETLFFDVWPDPAAWGPIHAWRALGELQATEAVDVLLNVSIEWGDSDWVMAEMPLVIARLGPSVIDSLIEVFFRPGMDDISRLTVVEALGEIGRRYSGSEPDCTAALTTMLKKFEQNDRRINATIIHVLTELKAVESAPLIEKAFAANRVDLSLMGDWESAQIELGLLDERMTPAPHWTQAEMANAQFAASIESDGAGEETPSNQRTAAEKKRKQARKQAKATKKKQRKSKKKKRK